MNPEELPQRLAEVKSASRFFEVLHELQHWSKEELFATLFPIASDFRRYPYPAYATAANLLVALEPRCPLSCREILIRLGDGHLEASLRQLPFYLVTQFGRHQLAQEADALLAEPGLDERVREAVHTLRYWTKIPAGQLIGHFAELVKKPEQ
jgi:hypothetical protein